MAFDPNSVAQNNGNLVGLPFKLDDCKVALYAIPWDVSVSSGEGTATASKNILNASLQLDLEDTNVKDAWKKSAIYFLPVNQSIESKNKPLRIKAKAIIEFLENGGVVLNNPIMERVKSAINEASQEMVDYAYKTTKLLREANKLVGLVGGDHSTPYGHIKALSEENSFAVLQFDAHMDLREAYEGFTHSHASIMHNILKFPGVKKLVQVGIRDFCEAEKTFAESQGERVKTFYEAQMRREMFEGKTFSDYVDSVLEALPNKVYISFDIDCLNPSLCPNTGTPVPGGFSFEEIDYFIYRIIQSGKEMVGFDLVEVGGSGNDWDGNVGARVLYKLSNALAATQPL